MNHNTVIAIMAIVAIIFIITTIIALRNIIINLGRKEKIVLGNPDTFGLPDLTGASLLAYYGLSGNTFTFPVLHVSPIQIDRSVDVKIQLPNGNQPILVFDLDMHHKYKVLQSNTSLVTITLDESFFRADHRHELYNLFERQGDDLKKAFSGNGVWESIILGPGYLTSVELEVTPEIYAKLA